MRELQERKERAPATLRATGYHFAHLIGYFGAEKPLQHIGLPDTSKYLAHRLAEGAERHTVAKELIALGQALRRAAKLGLLVLSVDPKALTPEELGEVYKPRDRWLTKAEFKALRATLAPNRRDYLDAYCYLGVRADELFSVQPEDYDARAHTLFVRGTKTKKSQRVLPVAADIRANLKLRCRSVRPFPVWHTVGRDLKRACARAKILDVSPNDLRRTFCSWLCQAGVPERMCADLLGHEDTTMVRAVYGHLDQKSMAAAVAKLPRIGAGQGVAQSLQQKGSDRASRGKARSQNTRKTA